MRVRRIQPQQLRPPLTLPHQLLLQLHQERPGLVGRDVDTEDDEQERNVFRGRQHGNNSEWRTRVDTTWLNDSCNESVRTARRTRTKVLRTKRLCG
jgi:hypothetical protein